MKKLSILLLSIVMIFAMTACGSKEEPEPAEVPAEEPAVELDALAGTTYQMTESLYENENGEMTAAELSEEQPNTITFGTDGTYTEKYYEPDFENGDLDTLVEKTADGTYTIDGDTVVLSGRVVEANDSESAEDAVSEELAAATTPTITMDGDTLIFEIKHADINNNGSEMTITAKKTVYAKQ